MPIGPTCRACGAPLPPNLGWCARCYEPVTTFAARPKLHEPGSFVGTPRPDVRWSRWRAGPTTMGPVGRIAVTALLLLIAPWWAIVLPLRSVWRKTRMPDDAPPTALDRFAERHPLLGRELRVPAAAKVAIAIVAIAVAVVIWLTKDSVDRLVWVGIVVLVGGSLVLGREHDL